MANPYKSATESFWELYAQGRPGLPDDLLQRVWDWHASHGGKFELAHETGAGIGMNTKSLAERFDKVIVSDAEEHCVNMATKRLKGLNNIEYRLAKMENAVRLPKAGVDIILAINMLHFTDTNKMLEAIQRQLKPGGTFAAITIGPAKLDDAVAQNIWKRLWWSNLEAETQRPPKSDGKVRDHTWLKRFVSGLDAVPLPDDMYEPGAVRLHINTETDWYDEILPPGLQYEALASQASETDRLLSLDERESWSFETDIRGLRLQLAAMAPSGLSAKVERSLEELEHALDDGKVTGRFLGGCLLATKRR